MLDVNKFIDNAIRDIQHQVGDKTAIIALSGGVDSATAAILIHRAIGTHLVSVFVDHGFMRKDEPKEIEKIYKEDMGMNVLIINAQNRFLSALKGIKDPEKKRKIIGENFIHIFEEVAKKEATNFLVQGTIAPDWIESEGGIKSHHNVAGLPKTLNLELIEPLRDLYKDEVRKVARALGLSTEISERMPFPGPGLAVRILGEVTPKKIEIIKEANAIVEEEIFRAGIKPWQALAALLEGRSVAVKGDIREYGYTIAIRSVESVDAMTATSMSIPWKTLNLIMKRITQEIPNVTRVLYDLTDKPPATIEFE